MEFAKKENSRWYTLSFWWFFLVSVSIAFLSEGIAFLEGYGVLFTDAGYFLICGVTLLLCLSYCVFAHLHFHIRPAWVFFGLFLALGIGNVLALTFFPKCTEYMLTPPGGGDPYSKTYVLESMTRLRYMVSFALSCFYFYIFWGIAPKCLRSSKSILLYTYGFLLMCLILIVYSWIAEWGLYVDFFDTSVARDPHEVAIASFTGNRNTFASILLAGVVVCGIHQSRRHCWANYVLMAIFSFELLLIFSKTCLVILPFYLVCFIAYRYIVTVRFHPIRSSVCLGVFIVLVGALALVWALCTKYIPNSFFGKMTELFKTRLFTPEHGTMDARYEFWVFAVQQMDTPFRIIFGLGEGNMQWFLGNAFFDDTYGYIHSGYFLQYCAGGAIRLGVYAFLLGYFLYIFVRALIRRRKGTLPYLFAFGAMLVHGYSEVTSFLETDGKGVLICLMLILPLLIDHHKKAEPRLLPSAKVRTPMSKGLTFAYSSFAFLSLASALMIYLSRLFGWDVMYSIVAFGVANVFLPLFPIISCCKEKKSFLRGYLPMCLAFLGLSALEFLIAYYLPLEQIATSITQFTLFVFIGCVLLLASFRDCLDFSSLSSFQQRLENKIAFDFPKWFKRGERRERLYYLKP